MFFLSQLFMADSISFWAAFATYSRTFESFTFLASRFIAAAIPFFISPLILHAFFADASAAAFLTHAFIVSLRSVIACILVAFFKSTSLMSFASRPEAFANASLAAWPLMHFFFAAASAAAAMQALIDFPAALLPAARFSPATLAFFRFCSLIFV